MYNTFPKNSIVLQIINSPVVLLVATVKFVGFVGTDVVVVIFNP